MKWNTWIKLNQSDDPDDVFIRKWFFVGVCLFLVFEMKSCYTERSAESICLNFCNDRGKNMKDYEVKNRLGAVSCECGGEINHIPMKRP